MTDEAQAAAPAKKRGCGFWVMIGLGVLVALAVIGALFGPSEEELAAVEAEERGAAAARATEVTAMQLWQAYEANEAAAQQQYGDRPLRVTGTIEGIQLDFSDDPFATLETGNMFQSVQVGLADEDPAKVAALGKGQQLTALCTEGVSEVVGTPILRGCTIE